MSNWITWNRKAARGALVGVENVSGEDCRRRPGKPGGALVCTPETALRRLVLLVCKRALRPGKPGGGGLPKHWPRGALVGLVVAGCCSLGCGGGEGRPAKNYKFSPVKGRVLAGGQPLTTGTVSFSPVDDPAFMAGGSLTAEGTFTLTTTLVGGKVAGAPEGQYRVSVSVPPEPGRRPVGPFGPPEVLTVQPGENDFTIQIPPATTPAPSQVYP